MDRLSIVCRVGTLEGPAPIRVPRRHARRTGTNSGAASALDWQNLLDRHQLGCRFGTLSIDCRKTLLLFVRHMVFLSLSRSYHRSAVLIIGSSFYLNRGWALKGKKRGRMRTKMNKRIKKNGFCDSY